MCVYVLRDAKLDFTFPETLGLLDTVDILDGAGLAVTEVFQARLHAIETAGNDLVRMTAEPTLLQAQTKQSEPGVAQILQVVRHAVHGADGRERPVHRRGHFFVLAAGEDDGQVAVRVECLDDVLVGAVFRDGVEGVEQFLARGGGALDALDDFGVALAVVDDDVPFRFVEEALNERDAPARHGDDGVDLGADEEFDCKRADRRGGAVDDHATGQRVLPGLRYLGPWLGKAQAGEESHDGGHGRERDGGGLLEAGLLGEMERRLLPGDGVLGEAAVRLAHFVEGAHAVADVEFRHVAADGLHVPSDVVARVEPGGSFHEQWIFPVLGVRARHDDPDQNLVRVECARLLLVLDLHIECRGWFGEDVGGFERHVLSLAVVAVVMIVPWEPVYGVELTRWIDVSDFVRGRSHERGTRLDVFNTGGEDGVLDELPRYRNWSLDLWSIWFSMGVQNVHKIREEISDLKSKILRMPNHC